MTTTTQLTSPVSASQRRPALVLPGLAVGVAAAVVTMLLAAVLEAIGADYTIADTGEAITVPGFALVTFTFSIVGLGLAAAFRRWSRRPRTRFVQVTVLLTAVSLVPPFINGFGAGTVVSLVALHLTAAAIVIPAMARRLPA